MESKKINQLATELAPDLSDLTIIGDPTTGISKKITLSQMASLFTGTVEEYANLAAFPLVGVADTIYIALDTNILYRWNTGTSAYVELSPNIVSSLVFNDANGFDGTINLVGSVATLTITTALTTGSVPFIGASGALSQDNANLFFDDTNNRLGINTNAPTTALDVFGSGIIGRLNGTSTNNSFLGFASAGTNKWSIGNVQSDHRFRIYNEATTSELVSVLSTGEFGIGIANPTTKFHIDGAASALIANLDANVSVAKSISFRSDNSARINLEVSGTESGSNVGADLFIRRYSDAGALIDTPLTITRSTGAITLATALSGTSASFSSTATATAFIPSGATIPTNGMYLSAANTLNFATNSTNRLSISSTGHATFSGNILTNTGTIAALNGGSMEVYNTGNSNYFDLKSTGGNFALRTNLGATPVNALTIASTGAATFISSSGISLTIQADWNRSATNDSQIYIKGNTNSNKQLRIGYDTTGNVGYIQALTSGTSVDNLLINPSGGNVLIGTTTDRSFKLVVEGTDNNNLMGSYNTTSGASLRMQSNQTINYIVSATNQLQFEVGAAIRMLMTTAGDIYMGSSTTDKNSRLVVYGSSTGSGSFAFRAFSSGSDVLLSLRNDGAYLTGTSSSSPYNNLTASSPNMVVSSGGGLERSTSSIRFKTQIEDLTIDTTSILSKMRPIWYRSKTQNDNKNWSWYGFIAEELAEFEPRLVHWGYDLSQYETIEIQDEEGNIKKETKLKDGEQLIPDGVQYERITVLLVAELQKMRKELDALKAK